MTKITLLFSLCATIPMLACDQARSPQSESDQGLYMSGCVGADGWTLEPVDALDPMTRTLRNGRDSITIIFSESPTTEVRKIVSEVLESDERRKAEPINRVDFKWHVSSLEASGMTGTISVSVIAPNDQLDHMAFITPLTFSATLEGPAGVLLVTYNGDRDDLTLGEQIVRSITEHFYTNCKMLYD